MEPEGLLPWPQQPASGPYPEPDESGPHLPTQFLISFKKFFMADSTQITYFLTVLHVEILFTKATGKSVVWPAATTV
jgi:hypothetical protein